MQTYEVDGHAPSLVPDGYRWQLVWHDEFDGTELDRTKWDYRLHMMGKRHITWQDKGIALDGQSNAVFTVFEQDGEICSAQLQTGYNFMDAPVEKDEDCWGGGLVWPIGRLRNNLYTHRYGYYECRCKLQKKEGWWSAFWLQSPTIGCCNDPGYAGIENDIMESFHPGEVIHHSNHLNGYADDHIGMPYGEGAKGLDLDEYHTFSMLWTPDGYVFYIDGQEDGRSKPGDPVSHRPEFILISTEVNGYRSKTHTATAEARAAVGDTFVVDYVRVFDIV